MRYFIFYGIALAGIVLPIQAAITTPTCNQQTTQCKRHVSLDLNKCHARHHSMQYRQTVCNPSHQLETDSCYQQRLQCQQAYHQKHTFLVMAQASIKAP